MGDQELTLKEAKKRLEMAGLRPADYKHLTYEKIIELARGKK